MYDYLDLRQIKRLKELVPYKVLAPDADEIIEELERLNNVIDEIEKWLKEYSEKDTMSSIIFGVVLQHLMELKEKR